MPLRTIPILPHNEPRTPRLSGDPAQLRRVVDALDQALLARIGWRLPVNAWLRELRLDDGEAFVAISPELGGACGPSAEVAFDTLRRLLPDTDIYVGAARG
ncbi:MAG: hypothetical protein C0505_12375 [Leptothrix sp. (in: Bacteria)]|nr:hypothetical protein [Leptothrix sp. (in: b-proteobacteria)]